jgi:hypothetical protein
MAFWFILPMFSLPFPIFHLAGLLLVYPQAAYDAIGFALLVAAVVLQLVRRHTAPAASG